MSSPHSSAPLTPALEPSRTNWAGNYRFRAAHLATPTTTAELQDHIRSLPAAKALGSRHSFNHIADTEGTQIDLRHFKSMTLDREAKTATVGAGITYGELAPWLEAQGFAVHNLASLPHISVAGACATGTHGSGLHNGCLATAVRAMELINGKGEIVRFSGESAPQDFKAAIVHLGALGVLTSLTLNLVPSFQAAQMIYEDLSFDHLQHHLPEIFSAGYSVSLFTDWQQHRATQAWVKRKLNAAEGPAFPEALFGAQQQQRKLHPLPNISAESCTEQQGIAGAWYERLPHFRLDYTPSAGAELQTEYFVPLEQGYEAIFAVEQLRDRITPHLLISELRTIAADSLPLSMASGRDSLALHFTWKQELEPVLALLPAIEEALAPFQARPHWAKLFTMPPAAVLAQYPQLDRFHVLRQQHDPQGRFYNAFLQQLFGSR